MRIRHKGLRDLAERNESRQLPPDLVAKLRRVLTLLDEARYPGDLAEQPGYRLHPLKGDMAGLWSIRGVGQLAGGVRVRGQRGGGRGPGGLPLRGGDERWRC